MQKHFLLHLAVAEIGAVRGLGLSNHEAPCVQVHAVPSLGHGDGHALAAGTIGRSGKDALMQLGVVHQDVNLVTPVATSDHAAVSNAEGADEMLAFAPVGRTPLDVDERAFGNHHLREVHGHVRGRRGTDAVPVLADEDVALSDGHLASESLHADSETGIEVAHEAHDFLEAGADNLLSRSLRIGDACRHDCQHVATFPHATDSVAKLASHCAQITLLNFSHSFCF